MFFERLKLEEQGEISQREIFKNIIEIPPHEFLHRHFIVLAALGNVVQETGKRGLIDPFKLSLHIAQVRGQFQLQSIVKVDLVGGVDAPEFKMIAHRLAERGKGLLPDFRHEEKRWSDVETVTVTEELITTPTRGGFFFQ